MLASLSNIHTGTIPAIAKTGSTALPLVVEYGDVNKKTQNHSRSIPNMENTRGRIAKC